MPKNKFIKAKSVSPVANQRHPSRNRNQKKVVLKQYDELPNRYRSKIDPLNLEELKQQFLNHGQVPRFQFKVSPEQIEELAQTKRAEIEFDLLEDVCRILGTVREKYGPGNACMEQMYGEPICADRANQKLNRYLQQNGADGLITIGWSKDQACSARMAWCGPNMKHNRPEARKFSLWVKDSTDNVYLREKGILCLADHEIGTHFFRHLNDGFQPWYSNREQFGLKKIRSHHLQETEEGLACINTIIQAGQRFLWIPALTYYTACKAATMTFKELFAHLGYFVDNRELRWRYVMRVKRSLPDPAGVGGYGNDQCYFKGAVDILRNLDTIDFHLLYAGKVCIESLPRIQRVARLDCIGLPHFMKDMTAYTRTLRLIASVNGLSAASKSSSGPKRGIGGKQRPKKLKSGSAGRKKRAKSTPKTPAVENEQDAFLQDDQVCVEDCSLAMDVGNNAAGEQGNILFDGTFHQAVGSGGRQTSAVSGPAAVEAVRGSNNGIGSSKKAPHQKSKDEKARRYLTKSFLHSSDPAKSSPQTGSRPGRDSAEVPDGRSTSQPLSQDPEENGHPSSPIPSTPFSYTRQPTPPHRSRFGHSYSMPKQVTLVAPQSNATCCPVRGKFGWGSADRPSSPAPSTMPNVASRNNRNKSDSPVPFSPHRWLLWRRGKNAPNSLNSST